MDQVGAYGHTITLVHYVYRVEPERIACMPSMTEFHATPYHTHYTRTNATKAVTCPACKKTQEFLRADQA